MVFTITKASSACVWLVIFHFLLNRYIQLGDGPYSVIANTAANGLENLHRPDTQHPFVDPFDTKEKTQVSRPIIHTTVTPRWLGFAGLTDYNR